MELNGAEVYRVLVAKGVSVLHHANTVTTSCTFLQEKGLASRGYVEARSLRQTSQVTDAKDKRYGIWNDVFTDGVDVHYRGGKKRGWNLYGPVLFKIPVATLLRLPEGSHVMITKKNPYNWVDGEPDTDRYFGSIMEFENGYSFGNFDKHIMIRTRNGILPFSDSPVLIDLDNPQRKMPDGRDAYSQALEKLQAVSRSAGLVIAVTAHKCQPGCRCVELYASSPNFVAMF